MRFSKLLIKFHQLIWVPDDIKLGFDWLKIQICVDVENRVPCIWKINPSVFRIWSDAEWNDVFWEESLMLNVVDCVLNHIDYYTNITVL